MRFDKFSLFQPVEVSLDDYIDEAVKRYGEENMGDLSELRKFAKDEGVRYVVGKARIDFSGGEAVAVVDDESLDLNLLSQLERSKTAPGAQKDLERLAGIVRPMGEDIYRDTE